MAFIVFMTAFLFGAIELSFAHQGIYVVETRLVFDKKAVDNFAKLYQSDISVAKELMIVDANILMNEVNKYFKSLEKYHVKIEARLKKLEFLTEDIITGTEDGYTEIIKVKDWMKKDKTQYDMSLLLTGYGHYKKGSSRGGVCKNHGVIVTYSGTQETALVMTQMISIMTGGGYDSDSTNCHDRNDISEYVMDKTINPKNKNRWYFSKCSADLMILRLTSLDFSKGGLRDPIKKNCLKQTTTQAQSYDFKAIRNTRLGHIYHRYYICSRALQNSNARFCRKPLDQWRMSGDKLCQTMYCLSPTVTKNKCVPVMPTEGMPCSGTPDDFSKICQRGKCVPDPK